MSQVLASGTNFLVLMALARSQGAEQFGWSALSVAVVTASVGVTRSALGTSISLSAASPEHLRREGRFGVTVGVVAVLILALPFTVWAATIHDWTILIISLASPFIVMQDLLRQICFSGQRASLAFHADLFRFALALPPALLTGTLSISPQTIIGLWWASAVLTAGYLVRRLSWRPYRGNAYSHWQNDGGMRYALLGDSLLVQLTPVVTSFMIGAGLTPIALSAFRGGSTLLGPISILLTAVPLLVLPKLVRDEVGTFGEAFARLRTITWSLSAACVFMALASIAAPDDLGQYILGDSWKPASAILPLMALQFALQPWALSVSTGLKLVGRGGALVWLRVMRSTVLVIAVASTIPSGSVVVVVGTILVVEIFTTVVYLFLGHRFRSLPVQTPTRPSTTLIGEA